MPSSFTWLDYSETQRRRMLDVLDLFREQGTRDELGISTIRDAFADLLFPGTGSLQTRARYFLFVPWMYLQFEKKETPSAQIDQKSRRYELDLIDVLAATDDHAGTIGIQARRSLQRLPSSIYWSGLGTLRIRMFGGPQEQYHRSLDAYYRLHRSVPRAEDREAAIDRRANWALSLPPAPQGFPDEASFLLTREEAEYLRLRILSQAPRSLLALLVDRAEPKDFEGEIGTCWGHPLWHQFPAHIRRQLGHAQNFSQTIFGASLLYNLMLAEEPPQMEKVIADLDPQFAEWCELLDTRRSGLRDWDRQDFWRCVAEGDARVTRATRLFVERWLDLATTTPSPGKLRQSESARSLIEDRERMLKGPLARLGNLSARRLWNGAAGLIPLDYRWRNAHTICRDILMGLSGGAHA